MEVDHYSVLGLPTGKQGAKLSTEEITTAYRRKCKQLHPDKRPGNSNAHAEFLKLRQSYEVLKDETTRKCFDDLMEKKMKADGMNRGVKRQRQDETPDFQHRETKRAPKAAAAYQKFTRIQRFDIDEIRRAVFGSKKSHSHIPLRGKGVQVSCSNDDQEIRVQAFPMEGVWVKLG